MEASLTLASRTRVGGTPIATAGGRAVTRAAPQPGRAVTRCTGEGQRGRVSLLARGGRRGVMIGTVGGAVGGLLLAKSSAAADKIEFTKAGGIEYHDSQIGLGQECFDGDTIKILYTAHTYDPEDGKKLDTFNPFILGGAGASMEYGFKLTLGEGTGDIIPGWNKGMLGGDGVEPMRQGGARVIRIPPELAYGSEGHLCKRNVKTACEVPPNTPVEIEIVFIDFV